MKKIGALDNLSIKTTLISFFALLVSLLMGLVWVMTWIAENQSLVAASESRRYESYKLADELRQSSDDLTRMARTYVVTADPIYEKYFYDILAIRNGEMARPDNYDGIYWDFVDATHEKPTPDGEMVSLQELMIEMSFTEGEFSKLGEAQKNSDALTRLEAIAMNAVKGKYDDGAGNFTVEKPPDFRLARELMHGERYHQAGRPHRGGRGNHHRRGRVGGHQALLAREGVEGKSPVLGEEFGFDPIGGACRV